MQCLRRASSLNLPIFSRCLSLNHFRTKITRVSEFNNGKNQLFSLFLCPSHFRTKFTRASDPNNGEEEWNEAWEAAWLPENVSAKTRAPWETDVSFTNPPTPLPVETDSETKAFLEEMNENWNERRSAKRNSGQKSELGKKSGDFQTNKEDSGLYSVENLAKDYRLKKQRIHASLWTKEIEKEEEAKLGGTQGNDIERLLDSCSEIFDHGDEKYNNSKVPSTSELKNKPDGWESTSKSQDGNIWELSQREEDILLQEFERRIAFSKFQIASFIKSHIFSRRRPVDGWKYMIEELGPNAKRGKGSVQRLPSLSDSSTRPFNEEKPLSRSIGNRTPPPRKR
ncbi:hypothetical protein AMTRI_Chr04g189950 [Amborella trichopoda]|uniref:Mucin-like protein n=1 Tax=Amborella trichopoda TaxID=13333 RepID=W1NGX0_AMBTC|nr:uncharacterized protein LOC18422444 [Amborella trichopoda]ERM94415.1 hypothetical protein AMTR_s00010p00256310 [Amborella trichopoda]|eukprot:XP_006827178.1 uncharacterized protein LOC18422444 [Amborella trichopoda]